MVNGRRYKTLEQAALQRRFDIGVLLENVNDPHNISAILRTCDAVGIAEVHVLETAAFRTKRLGFHSSRSASKWVKVYYYQEFDECVNQIKHSYGRLAVAGFAEGSASVYNADLGAPLCIAFGNEQKGCTNELIAAADLCFHIPQVGLLQSLNISVACGVVLYEWFRQQVGIRKSESSGLSTNQQDLLEWWTDPLRNKQFKESL